MLRKGMLFTVSPSFPTFMWCIIQHVWAHDVVVVRIQLLPYCWRFPKSHILVSLQPWNLLWRWRSLRMRSYCHFTRWACSGALIRSLDKISLMCIPGAPLSYPRKMNVSPASITHFERQLLFAQGVYLFVQICVCRLLQTTTILRCVTSLSQSFWPSRYTPLGQLTNICNAHSLLDAILSNFVFLEMGRRSVELSITKTSGACTLLTLSAQLSRWKLSRRFQLTCLSLGGLARVMVSSQSFQEPYLWRALHCP